jgi:hypothetical protein
MIMVECIYRYGVMNSRWVSTEQRKKDFRLIKRYKLRGVVSWFQVLRLYGVRGFFAKGSLPEALRNKQCIFVVSFHKNGTRSIHAYLEKLGFKGVHWPVFANTGIDYEYILGPLAQNPRQCAEALAPLLDEYDFFGDVPFPGLFREMAELFPQSKFILTHRPPQEWWESVWRHWRKSDPPGSPHKLSLFEAIQYHLPVGAFITEADRSNLIERYVNHTNDVRAYFSGTERLLCTDLSDPNLNVDISRFLGISNVLAFSKIREGTVYV